MKQLVCEMCGSTDLIKQDGLFVCQCCGCKYSPEEAKKMMIEGTVDIRGTVKLDNAEYVKNCLLNARRSKQKEDWEETEKYYKIVEQNEPTNIEAIFYSSYAKAMSSLVDGDLYKRQAAFNVLQNSISLLADNLDLWNEYDQRKFIKEMNDDIIKMRQSGFVYNELRGEWVTVSSDKNATIAFFNELSLEFMLVLEKMAEKNYNRNEKIYYYELCITHAEIILKSGIVLNNSSFIKDKIMDYHKEINQLNPAHEVPEPAENGVHLTMAGKIIIPILVVWGIISFFIGISGCLN